MTRTSDKAEAAWGRIIPFLRPIEALLRDPEISDIMINGERAVFFEKNGRMERLPGATIKSCPYRTHRLSTFINIIQ